MSAKYSLSMPSIAGSLLDLMNSPNGAPALLPLNLTKRAEYFLEEMIEAGPTGITTIDYPGVRVGDAVHKLRKAGVKIETQYEQHGGEFAGQHGRYVLRSRVVCLADIDRNGGRDMASQGHEAAP